MLTTQTLQQKNTEEIRTFAGRFKKKCCNAAKRQEWVFSGTTGVTGSSAASNPAPVTQASIVLPLLF